MNTTEQKHGRNRWEEDKAYIIGLCLGVVVLCIFIGVSIGIGLSAYRFSAEERAIHSYGITAEGICFQGVLYNVVDTDTDSFWEGRKRLRPDYTPQPSYFDDDGNENLRASLPVKCKITTD